MKRLAWQSGLLVVAAVLICVFCRLQNNTYTARIPLTGPEAESDGSAKLRMVPEEGGENNTGSIIFGEPRPEDKYAEVRMKPGERGYVWAQMQNESGETLSYSRYHVSMFGTVYDYSTGGFTGDSVVMVVMAIFCLAESLLLLLAFLRAKGPSFYAYSTIHTAGFSLFMLLTGITILSGTIRHLTDPADYPMLYVYELVITASYHFIRMTLPLILLFAASMTVSNIALLRHESRRLRNVLGILISFFMAAGAALALWMHSLNFSGSETEYWVRMTVITVYATVYVYFECMLIGAVICGVIAAKHIPEGDCGYIIILGCGFRKDGSLPPLLKGRVDRAVSFWKQQKEKGVNAILIPSGGQGRDETMAEAEAMHRYLASQNIPEESILLENKSANTYQNMEFSKKLIEENGAGSKVVFSTTNYHVFRSGVWASLAGLKAEGIGSRTKWWFWPNAFMRECVGLLVNRWKQELLFLVLLNALFGVLAIML